MADVENVSSVSAIATTNTVTVIPTEIPITTGSFNKSIVLGGGGSDLTEGNQTPNDLGTSPTQEKSSNSHPHDSEYDTASDLEGNEEYDDDDMDDSLTEDDESDDETETDDDEEEEDEGVDIDLQGQEKIDAEAQKKVDEDQGDIIGGVKQEETESPLVITGGTGNVSAVKTSSTPTISAASKTMKKWQPASAVDRWSHDRFDPSEQAPKSRAELVNAYGYDIRTEDAPQRPVEDVVMDVVPANIIVIGGRKRIFKNQ
ncbi:Protein CASC3 [Eumeta japonica]|uniref:Protein CASC3 n=1 Tax=Eumeta variegata TaxID=151549 RepID=A0A4C1T684_EUMVA|nr:Protein CASC3 [Eumeta japonica]